jgi:hypothetical protein
MIYREMVDLIKQINICPSCKDELQSSIVSEINIRKCTTCKSFITDYCDEDNEVRSRREIILDNERYIFDFWFDLEDVYFDIFSKSKFGLIAFGHTINGFDINVFKKLTESNNKDLVNFINNIKLLK